MQPFSPLLIVVATAVGLALGVFAVVHQPGSPVLSASGPGGSNTADALTPLKLNDAPNLKLFNN
jgi:hypothetical protein